MTAWPQYVWVPLIFFIIGGGGIGGAFLTIVFLELIGQGPEAKRRKKEAANPKRTP